MLIQIMPSLFVAHGAPTLATDVVKAEDFKRWGLTLPKAKAILVFSAHWEGTELAFGETTQHNKLIYDFGGFPDHLYDLQYSAPGAPFLTDRIKQLLNKRFKLVDTNRGLDHGVWVPFLHLWPDADVPVLQISMPRNLSDKALFELGRSLRVLRSEGVIIVGSGVLTHNLRKIIPNHSGAPLEWSAEFDQWVEETLLSKDYDALINWQDKAPNATLNHPTTEHFRPLLVAAGAAENDAVDFPVTGFEWGSLSRRSVQFS